MTKRVLGEVELLILMAILHLGQKAYGMAIAEEIEKRTGRKVSRAAVYVALKRLEEKDFVETYLESPPSGGKPRRYARVLPQGLQLAKASLDTLTSMASGLEPMLEEG
ncbi:MAG TPA: helix-turn-helix transcriptional regulator [Acidobacteriota bacterium]|nr:helix-turn-helix transcriptional regulator [Acidobacteriota bacterium]